jgi:hypothetical protein
MAAMLQRKLPELRMEAIAAGDVVDFLRDVTGANIYVDTRALRAVGGDPNAPITVSVRDVAFGDVLRQLVIPQMSNNRGTFLATGGVIIITAGDDVPRLRAARDWHANMPLTPAAKTSLDRQLPEVNFSQIPVGDTIDFLRDITAANIFVNWRTLEVAGVTRKQPVTLRLRNVSFRTVLWLLLESAQAKSDAPLDFRVENEILIISTAPDIALSEKRAPAPAPAPATQKSPASAPRR